MVSNRDVQCGQCPDIPVTLLSPVTITSVLLLSLICIIYIKNVKHDKSKGPLSIIKVIQNQDLSSKNMFFS